MDLALNIDDADLETDGGDLFLVAKNDAVAQHVGQRVKTNLGEWFLDEQRGYPYFDLVFKKAPDYVAIDATMKDYVLASPGLVELTSFELSMDGSRRELSLAFTGRSKDGIIEFQDTVGG